MPKRLNRANEIMRDVRFETEYTKHAEGSVLACTGDTKVLCTASITDGVPKFLKDAHQGWLTAEYSMLPRATHTRCDREAQRGKQTGRTVEIQRLIGRSLRSCIDLSKIPDTTIVLDCDVIQADGGTRTTAINGCVVALILALQHRQYQKKLTEDPMLHLITAVSLGLIDDEVRLDLDYTEDSQAQVDSNIVLNEHGGIIEIQATAERAPLTQDQLTAMLRMAQTQQAPLLQAMREACGLST